jgi:sugar-specific transcriptional regulator TrmB
VQFIVFISRLQIDKTRLIIYGASVNTFAIDRLMKVGLTQYEARVYVALVRRDGSTPSEVARMAGVPRPRIYDVLESLVAKGLAALRPGGTAKYLAIAPAEAMERLIEAQRRQLGLLEADAQAAVEELSPAYQEGRHYSDPLDYIEVIHDPDLLAKRFAELQSSVRREMLTFSKDPYAVRIEKNLTGMKLAGRYVLRSVYEVSVLDDPAQREGVRLFAEAGEQARFVEELPMKLGIIDEKKVMLAMPDPVAGKDDLTTVVIEHPHLARILKIAFESVWQIGMTAEDAYRHLGIDVHQ